MSVVAFGTARPVLTRKIIDVVKRARVDLSDEKRTQRDLASAFEQCGIEHQREFRLSPKDIVDFLITDIALEVKLKSGSSKMDIYRQLVRYSEHAQVASIILASNLSMGLPEELSGKPVYFVPLGRAWI